MDMIAFFGNQLAELTGLYEIGCVALIKLAIQDASKNPSQISYQEMRDVFQVQLLKRLERIRAKDPAQIAAQMLSILNERQSIFTMSAR